MHTRTPVEQGNSGLCSRATFLIMQQTWEVAPDGISDRVRTHSGGRHFSMRGLGWKETILKRRRAMVGGGPRVLEGGPRVGEKGLREEGLRDEGLH